MDRPHESQTLRHGGRRTTGCVRLRRAVLQSDPTTFHHGQSQPSRVRTGSSGSLAHHPRIPGQLSFANARSARANARAARHTMLNSVFDVPGSRFPPLPKGHRIKQLQRLIRSSHAGAHPTETILTQFEVLAKERFTLNQETLPDIERGILERYGYRTPFRGFNSASKRPSIWSSAAWSAAGHRGLFPGDRVMPIPSAVGGGFLQPDPWGRSAG